MKKNLTLISFALAFSVSHAQTILACQYTKASGYHWNNSRWSPTNFEIKKPFFLQLKPDGKIDPASLEKLSFYAPDVSCKVLETYPVGKRVSCTDFDGGLISLNLNTYEGATGVIFGASQSNNTRDTISLNLFSCQKM